MSLSKRLGTVRANLSSGECRTCKWLKTLSTTDRAAWDSWIAEGRSLSQLHEIASTDADNPLTVSISALRLHQRHARGT